MFCDETKINIKAGRGGDGLVSFRREKYIAKGGPNGGNGGRGGDVIFRANENLNSLIHLHSKKMFQAESGNGGGTNEKAGVSGKDLIIEVPVGTQVYDADSKELLADFESNNTEAVMAVGGRGGYGNTHFKSSIRQTPAFAELGEPGEERDLKLDLKLVADVGIIGLPSAGKSTLISVLSDARPKIGDYPFTTLIPNLGVAKVNDNSLVFCDIPGLIEGAHEGKGLGDKFLRHIARNLVLIHLVPADSADPVKDVKLINEELEKFDENLTGIPMILAISKVDLIEEEKREEIKSKLQKKFPENLVIAISSAAGINTDILTKKAFEMVQIEKNKLKEKDYESEEKRVVLRPHLDQKLSKRFDIEKRTDKNEFVIRGPRIEQIAVMTDYSNAEAIFRLRDVLRKMGIEKELIKMGAERGDKLFFGDKGKKLEFLPELAKR